MNKYESIKAKLASHEPITMGNCMVLGSPFMLDPFIDMDCVLLDKEHGIYGTEELIPLTMRCRELGIPSIIRVEDSQYHLIAKAIDLGADGIMLPRTETVEQIKTAVEAMHFSPIGRTGFGGWGILRDGETIPEFQKGRFFFPQIESAKGLKAMPEMIEKYGEYIDGFIIGPNDYSITMGVPRDLDHPVMIEEIRKVFETCKAAGISYGCFAADAAHANLYASMGANIFWIGDDRTYMKLGIQSLMDGIDILKK